MRIPYIKINQKNEVFFITKFKASQLKSKINFHFREPYSNAPEKVELYQDYIDKLRRKGIQINADEEGVQRRIQINRINKIKTYLEEQEDSYFPTSIVLATDISNDIEFQQHYEELESRDFGYMDLSDQLRFQIVDGQHRLAGLFISNEDIQEDFEITAVLLFNATPHTCAKMFADINGNQTPVNRSVIYDLYDIMEPTDEETRRIKTLHSICKKLNNDPDSPLYLHLKMLGIGNGAISQAFFIQYLDEAIKDIDLSYSDSQMIYKHLFLYLKCFQRVFKHQWPVMEKSEYAKLSKFYQHSNDTLKNMKSQILKTNGFGALMMLFPEVYEEVSVCNYDEYFSIIKRLKSRIDWSSDPILTQGTGKKNQKKMKDKLKELLEL